ncbi:pentapeptide repeat-containing protein [Streptomyces sp. NPDC057910]|uniref:pentapeptide repeat-containing protein n=1 Tax=Streptomyces sp. NPDC057910 TaxID=3346278 RepID=UPI0036E9B8D8
MARLSARRESGGAELVPVFEAVRARYRRSRPVPVRNGQRRALSAVWGEGTYARGTYGRSAYLRGAHLRRAELRRAELRRAELRRAELRGSHETRAGAAVGSSGRERHLGLAGGSSTSGWCDLSCISCSESIPKVSRFPSRGF